MGRDAQRLMLAALVSLPGFGAGHLFKQGDIAAAVRLALATAMVVLLAAAIAHLPQPSPRKRRF